ncbi:MAG: acetate/propionate family kinase [Gemmatimonadaceae bacterium]
MAGLKILVFNAGSSSFKASLFDLDRPAEDGAAPVGLLWERNRDSPNQAGELVSELWTGPSKLIAGPDVIDVIGHRVVFGGPSLFATARVDDDVREQLTRMEEYAPAHNEAALSAIEEATRIFGKPVPQFAVFDTAFHQSMPAEAFTYAGPYEWVEKGIRRFGFHGLSHRYVSHRAARLMGKHDADARMVTCHLGSGCSLAAVLNGQSVDTTMGFTPLDGIPMARRSGAVDPGILLHLLRHGGYDLDSLDELLNNKSGLAGLSGTSGDMRDVLSAIDAGDGRAKLALDVFVHHVRQGVASMAASMGGLDALVFTGGVGENSPRVRQEICAGLEFLGIELDESVNASVQGEGAISRDGATLPVFVIPAKENWIVAQECLSALI